MQFSDHGRLQESLDDAFESRTTTHTVLMAVEAAVGEEARDILMPTVTVVLLLALINGRGRLTRHVGAGVRTASSWRWRVGIACLAGLAIRINDHLYQGAVFATAAAVWGAALLAIYLVYRSVIPLIMGHFIFDLLIGSSQWSSATTTWTLVLGGLAVAITYVLECRASRELGGSRVHETC